MQVLRAQDIIASLSEVAVFPPCRLKELQTTLYNTSVAFPRNSYPIFVANAISMLEGLTSVRNIFNLQACGHPAYYKKRRDKRERNEFVVFVDSLTCLYYWISLIYIYITHVCGEKY